MGFIAVLKDFFGNELSDKSIHVNIYADEVVDKKCPYTNHSWNYIGLIVENVENSLLTDIIVLQVKSSFFLQKFLLNFN